jgi:quercetin dioxygenase-like cupin family protein
MNPFEQQRRSLLHNFGFLGMSQLLPQSMIEAEATQRAGFVLGATEGEHLIHFRDHGKISIKIGTATGSENLAIGTQQVMAGTGIPIHRHFQMDESFYVLEGSGIVTLNDVHHPFEKEATIFIPKNSWHGFANPDHELLLLWIVTPAGLDGFFRDTCNPPGVPPKQFTREQLNEIARKYATEFK